MLAALRLRAPDHANFTLRINCRNAGPIAETLTLACNVKPGYSRFLHDMEGQVSTRCSGGRTRTSGACWMMP